MKTTHVSAQDQTYRFPPGLRESNPVTGGLIGCRTVWRRLTELQFVNVCSYWQADVAWHAAGNTERRRISADQKRCLLLVHERAISG